MFSPAEIVIVIKDLCAQRGLSVMRLEKDVGLGNGVIGKWSKGKKYPPSDRLQNVADYFGVPVTFLTGEQKEKPALNNEDELSPVSRELNEIVAGLSEAQAKAALEYIRLLKEAGK